MSAYQNIFKRYEMKYLISRAQYERLKEGMGPYMTGDSFGRSVICNIYFDTLDFLLIRRSIDHPVYKEKLRLRSYGIAQPDSRVFVELKKKYDAVVYKRRVPMKEYEAMAYLLEGQRENQQGQILKEIDYALAYYKSLEPAMFLSYRREAFYGKENREFRITFDEKIQWREYDLSLCYGDYGTPLLKKEQVLMEIKTGTSIPLWMTALLSQNHIYKTTFSKYGTAYRSLMAQGQSVGRSAVFVMSKEKNAGPFLSPQAVSQI